MLYTKINRAVAAVAAIGLFGAVPPAMAHTSASGGASAQDPTVAALRCDDGRKQACAAGEQLTIRGEALSQVGQVVFVGRQGRKDDQVAQPLQRAQHRLTLAVPIAAVTGPLKIVGASSSARTPTLKVDQTSASGLRASSDGFVFPIRGKHQIGTSAVQRFGGARNHKGQDIFAACGTPEVAAAAGTVQQATYESRAGNYVVVDGADGRGYVYMHMRLPAIVKKGDRVAAGQQIGEVGDTGDAEGCHLHFELWTAPGWYRGGQPIDPYNELRAWEKN